MLIYCYGAVCASMIVFNCVCIILFRRNDRRLVRKSKGLDKRIAVQTACIVDGNPVDSAHFRYLNRKLAHVGNLMAFDRSIDQCRANDPEIAQRYLIEIRPVFLYLSVVYLKKENMQSAYFAYLLAKYQICRYLTLDAIINLLKEYLKKDSLYCRQNALKALYSSGSEENVVEGIKVLEKEGIFLHSKVLADGLLTFNGDHQKLIALLWGSFHSFALETQVSILNYIRFQTGDYCERMFKLLTDPAQNQELHFAAIRYFAKYHYVPAHSVLMQLAGDTDNLHWNYAAFSATALANYPGEETVEVLKKALGSSNWYIRYNASQSLNELGVTYHELSDVINGNDRYAREMIQYQMDSRQLSRKEKEKR